MSTELRALVREIAANHPQAAPAEIAQYTAEVAPDDKLRDYLEETLYAYTVAMLGQGRRNAMDDALNGHSGNRSVKLEERRAFGKLMKQRVEVAGTGWKTVGECTIEDLRICIKERITQIERTQGQIENFEKLIALMEEHGVVVAKDLIGIVK